MKHILIQTKPFYDSKLKAMVVDIIDATSHHSDVLETKVVGNGKNKRSSKRR